MQVLSKTFVDHNTCFNILEFALHKYKNGF